MILGASGTGKSTLALELISRGASLVSDDRTMLQRDGDQLIASAPAPIQGLIEARGIGILKTPTEGPTPVALAVDMAQVETARLPQAHWRTLLDHPVRCLRRVEAPYFPAAILLCLAHGISDPT